MEAVMNKRRLKVLCGPCSTGMHHACYETTDRVYCICWLYDHDTLNPLVVKERDKR
jgi:hypothetical protein